jgi:hypothetical protein
LQPATFSPVFPVKRPRRATSPAVCRALPSCSKRASRRTMRSSRKHQRAASSSARTTRPSASIGIVPRGRRSDRISDPQVQGARRAGRRLREAGRQSDRRLARTRMTFSKCSVIEPLAEYLVARNSGSLPPAGREDQRQAHRNDRSPDAAKGRDHRCRRHHACWSANRSTARKWIEINAKASPTGGKPAEGKPILLGITKASACRPAASSRRPRSRKPHAC